MIFSSTQVYATSQADVDRLKNESENASKKVNEIQQKKKAQEAASGALANQATELSGAINELNGQISTVTSEITSAQEKISSVQSDIDTLTAEIEVTKKRLEKQRTSMQKRIQYMYENNSKSQLVALLESGTISEFLKRLEYLSQITSYDQNAIDDYAKSKAELEEKYEELSAKESELSEYEGALQAKNNELGTLVSRANVALDTTNTQLQTSKQMEAALEQELASAREYEKQIQAQYEAAQVELAKRLAGESGGYSGGYSTTDEETLLLAALIQAEAANQGSAGRLAVGSVVMNRVSSSKFPNSIPGVIYANNQFAPVASGRVAMILAQGPNSACQRAAADAIAGSTNTDALFFCTYAYAQQLHESQVSAGQAGFLDRTSGTVINAHYFYNYN